MPPAPPRCRRRSAVSDSLRRAARAAARSCRSAAGDTDDDRIGLAGKFAAPERARRAVQRSVRRISADISRLTLGFLQIGRASLERRVFFSAAFATLCVGVCASVDEQHVARHFLRRQMVAHHCAMSAALAFAPGFSTTATRICLSELRGTATAAASCTAGWSRRRGRAPPPRCFPAARMMSFLREHKKK